jgi:hypothetical protein
LALKAGFPLMMCSDGRFWCVFRCIRWHGIVRGRGWHRVPWIRLREYGMLSLMVMYGHHRNF